MPTSALASTIPMFPITLRKNGHCSYIRRSWAAHDSSPPANDSNAEPDPYQPGSISRHCVQPNTHGIARRSSIRPEPVRDAGRLPTLSDEISPIGVIAAWNPANVGSS